MSYVAVFAPARTKRSAKVTVPQSSVAFFMPHSIALLHRPATLKQRFQVATLDVINAERLQRSRCSRFADNENHAGPRARAGQPAYRRQSRIGRRDQIA